MDNHDRLDRTKGGLTNTLNMLNHDQISKVNMMTLSDIENAFVAYRVDVPSLEPRKPFFIGCCALSALSRLEDAWTYETFVNAVTPDAQINLTVLGVCADRAAAEAIQAVAVFADNVWINQNSARCEPPRTGRVYTRVGVRDLNTGLQYENAAIAAKAIGVTRSAMSMHLSGKIDMLKGRRFERIKQ